MRRSHLRPSGWGRQAGSETDPRKAPQQVQQVGLGHGGEPTLHLGEVKEVWGGQGMHDGSETNPRQGGEPTLHLERGGGEDGSEGAGRNLGGSPA